jgi:hypothetical protein
MNRHVSLPGAPWTGQTASKSVRVWLFAPNANVSTVRYGGSVKNRARFAIEVAVAIAEEIGASRTAIRLSPGSTMLGIDKRQKEPDLCPYLVVKLDRMALVYLHVMHPVDDRLTIDLRRLLRGTLILNRPRRPIAEIGADVSSGLADLEPFRPLLAPSGASSPCLYIRLTHKWLRWSLYSALPGLTGGEDMSRLMANNGCNAQPKLRFTKSQLTMFHHDSTNFGRALR